MICTVCQTENKENVKSCRKCGSNLHLEPLWRPTWQWHGKTLGVIYVVLILMYFGLSTFLKKIPEPYRMRIVPMDVTPWLKK